MAAYRMFVLLVTALLGATYFSYVFVLPEGQLSLIWTAQFNQYINTYAMTPYGHRLAIGTAEGDVYVYDASGKLICHKSFSSPVQDLAFSVSANELYVKTYNLLLLDISENSVLWEKFKPNHYIDTFWPYRNGNLGLLFLSKTSMNYVFMLINPKGQTLQEFDLPDMYESFEALCSDEDNFFFIASESSDLYHMSLNGMVNWVSRLDPPSLKSSDQPYTWLDMNRKGEVCLAYIYEQYGKKAYMLVFYNEFGEIAWKQDVKQAIIRIQFSPDGQKILMNTMEDLMILRTDGTALLQMDQWGYYSLQAYVFPTTAIVGFYSKYHIQNSYWSSRNEFPPNVIVRSFSLDYKEVKWQKRIKKRDQYFSSSADSRIFLEVIKPDLIQFYQYASKKT